MDKFLKRWFIMTLFECEGVRSSCIYITLILEGGVGGKAIFTTKY